MSERAGLWRHADFKRLWAAQIVSAYGSRITRTALPIIAITTLDQPEAIIGVLTAMQLAPGAVLALFAGGYVDRGDKRKILIGADLFRAFAVASLTLTWALGILSMAHVIIVGALVGAASALFQIADTAYLPTLIAKEQLAEGNAKIESTEAIAEITGPASAGLLIATIGAPLAVVVDAFSYLWSALWLQRIKTRAEPPVPKNPDRRRGDDIRIGMRAVFGHPYVRWIVISHMVWSICGGFFMSLYSLFCLRELGLSKALFGLVIAMGGIGSLAGAFTSRWLVRVLGLGPMLVIASAMSLFVAVFIPLASGSLALVLTLLMAHQLIADGFSVAFIIQAVTLRQTVLPKNVLGRANAAIHVCTAVLLPLSALIAGFLAEAIGTREAVWVGVSIGILPPLLLLPLWGLRKLPSESA
ncbi:MAG: MFS transporter [Deltaproteobacteria bacterium]|nr:MFS transporter [Deltaproteobacteria bacterium]